MSAALKRAEPQLVPWASLGPDVRRRIVDAVGLVNQGLALYGRHLDLDQVQVVLDRGETLRTAQGRIQLSLWATSSFRELVRGFVHMATLDDQLAPGTSHAERVGAVWARLYEVSYEQGLLEPPSNG